MARTRTALLAAALIAAPLLPAAAGSQSSNSSSNCSNGRCSRVESYSEEHRGHRWGHTRMERWREGRPSHRASEGGWWPAPPWTLEDRPRRAPRWGRRRGDD